ncbi:MAG: N-acetyltransferase [Bacteroidales bacterium]|nr:N-acetyltransferase [Bacteroidales bacterium]
MIRNVTPEDAADICSIYNYYIKNSIATFDESPMTPEEIALKIKKTTARYPWLVFELENSVGGFCYAFEWKSRPAYKLTVETTVYVANEYRESGIGKALLSSLLKMLKEYNFRNALGSIALPNEKSISLHEHLGYKKLGIIQKAGIKFGKEIDVGLWQKRL